MKLLVPPDVTSVSHDGIEIPVVNGAIDVDGDAAVMFHNIHGFKTEDDVAEEVAAETEAQAEAVAAVTSSKRKTLTL